ncbi:MAG: zinc ribbon domain-containing protein [Acutalibacteraceae bacterium]|nr:zinc ribbon domain-containing protein [Acutalibacteraceae bacterium]
MYCNNCGSQNPDNSKFCANCGAKFEPQNVAPNSMPISNNIQNNIPNSIPNNTPNSNYVKRPTLAGILLIISAVTAVFSAIMPFCTWADVPVADNIYSFFGGEGSISSYSLFTYTFASGTYTDKISGILLIVLLFAIFAMVMYGVYVTKVILKKKKCLKFLIIGSSSMLFVSLVFVLFIGLTSAVTFNLVNMTATPLISLLLAVANIVFAILINIERKKGKGDMFTYVETPQYYSNYNQNIYPNNVQGQQYNPQSNQQPYDANQYYNQPNQNNYNNPQQYNNFSNQQANQNNIVNNTSAENQVVNACNNSQEVQN